MLIMLMIQELCSMFGLLDWFLVVCLLVELLIC